MLGKAEARNHRTWQAVSKLLLYSLLTLSFTMSFLHFLYSYLRVKDSPVQSRKQTPIKTGSRDGSGNGGKSAFSRIVSGNSISDVHNSLNYIPYFVILGVFFGGGEGGGERGKSECRGHSFIAIY